MGEVVTFVFAATQALSHPIPMRLTVRAMATPSGLRSARLCGQRAPQAWFVDGGWGLHRELLLLVSKLEALAYINLGEGILKALHEVICVPFAVKDSFSVNIFLYVLR